MELENRGKGKRFWITVIVMAIIILGLSLSTGNGLTKSKEANEEITKLESDIKKVNVKVGELEAEIGKRDDQITELEKKVEEAEPWFAMSEKDRERKEAEEKEKQEAEAAVAKKKKKEEEKKELAAEEEKKRKAEEKEKKGYETGVTFEQLARTPGDYELEKVKFRGKVLQVMEADDSVQLRIAVDDDYDKVLFVEYDSDIIDSRVLEDDKITVMGISMGLLTYESTMGGNITIPALAVDKIEQ